jgi:outer membrane immunogenic protein
MYRVGLLAFTLTSVAALASANAADMYRAPEPFSGGGYKDGPVVQTWAGFYIGVNGGWAWAAKDQWVDPFVSFHGIRPEGGFGGGQIGYNWQNGAFVFGAEADIQGAGISAKGNDAPFFDTFKSRLDYFGTIRGRLGYTFGSSLLYATGGFAYGGIKNDLDIFTNHQTATGYTIGGGWEYKFNPAWSVKAEYQYINLGRNDPHIVSNICTTPGLKCEDDAFHTVRAGINYHFGSGYVPLK